MGFFDRFKRKSPEPSPAQTPASPAALTATPSTPTASAPATAKPASARGGQSRAHHYLLAHYAFRLSAFSMPLPFFGNLGSSSARATVADLLETVHLQCKDKEPDAGFTAADVKVGPRRMGDRYAVVIEMPPPQAITECYLVAVVLMQQPDPNHLDAKIPIRYFTLEFGYGDKPGSLRTVLCEWTEEGSHVNYGDGPEPTVPAFLERIETLIKRQEAGSSAG